MTEQNTNVIVIPARPDMANAAKTQRQLRVAAYCRVSTDDEEQLSLVRKNPCLSEKWHSGRTGNREIIMDDE